MNSTITNWVAVYCVIEQALYELFPASQTHRLMDFECYLGDGHPLFSTRIFINQLLLTP